MYGAVKINETQQLNPKPRRLEHGVRLGFSSRFSEQPEQSLPVKGNIPSWLNGVLLRTGPSRFEVGDQRLLHWFDGLAMLYRFEIRDGQVRYTDRFLQSAAFQGAQRDGELSFGEFATDPCYSLFGRLMAIFRQRPTDNANVNVGVLHDDVVAMTETRLPVRFDPRTLQTLGIAELDRSIPGPVSTAHPHYDHQRNRLYNFVIDFGYRSIYRLISIDQQSGDQQVLSRIPVRSPAYMHSFGMTENYLILVEYPLRVNPLRLLLSGQPFIRNYRWLPEQRTQIHVIAKDTGQVVESTSTRAMFGFHHVNAFESPEGIVVDLISYPDSGIIDRLYLDDLRSARPFDVQSSLVRLLIRGDRVEESVLLEEQIELPRIDYVRDAGRDYREVYAAAISQGAPFFDQLVRIETNTGNVRRWQAEGCLPGEPVFVRRPQGQFDPEAQTEAKGQVSAMGSNDSEAAGSNDSTKPDSDSVEPKCHEPEAVLLSVVLDANANRSFLLLLDADSMVELARAEAPDCIRFGFHGEFMPDIK